MSKLFSLIQGELHTAAGQKIIPSEEYSQLLSASEALEKATQDVENLKIKSEKEAIEAKERGQKEGFDAGLQSFNEHLLNFEKELKKLRHDMQQAIIPIALQAAKKIVARQLELSPETIVDIVMQALSPISQNHMFIIYVNKADREYLETQKPRIKEILEQVESLSIQERADIAPGGCVIVTEAGIVNATLENQWAALEKAFEKYMKH